MPEAEFKSVFISYAHEDELYKDALVKHLSGLTRIGALRIWSDTTIAPGQEWDNEIKSALHNADIIIFLVSADFMASNYIHNTEIEQAIAKHNAGKVSIVPIIIRSCDFRSLPLKKFQALPKNSVPVSKWEDKDDAYLNIVQGIKMLLVPAPFVEVATSEPEISPVSEEINSGVTKEFIDEMRNYISQNKTEFALRELIKIFSSGKAEERNACIVLQSRFNELTKKDRMGLIAYDEYSRSITGINIALLEILDSIN